MHSMFTALICYRRRSIIIFLGSFAKIIALVITGRTDGHRGVCTCAHHELRHFENRARIDAINKPWWQLSGQEIRYKSTFYKLKGYGYSQDSNGNSSNSDGARLHLHDAHNRLVRIPLDCIIIYNYIKLSRNINSCIHTFTIPLHRKNHITPRVCCCRTGFIGQIQLHDQRMQ